MQNEQIGWSQEARLLHRIIKQLEQLTKVVSQLTVVTTTTTAP